MDDGLVTAQQVIDWLPASIQADFAWCPARHGIGHTYRDYESYAISSMSGWQRTYTVRVCPCGDVRRP